MLPEKNFNGITFRIRHTMLPVSNMERTLDFTPAFWAWTSSASGMFRREASEHAI